MGVQVLCQFTPKCRKKALWGKTVGPGALNSRNLPGARKPDRGRTRDARPRASGDGEQAGGSDATEARVLMKSHLSSQNPLITASGGSPSNPQLCWGLLAHVAATEPSHGDRFSKWSELACCWSWLAPHWRST